MKFSVVRISIFFACSLLSVSSLARRESGFPTFHESTRYLLGGEGSWDFLSIDSTKRRLYVARSNRIMVVDVDNGKLVGEVPGVDGAHGVAVAPHSDLGFATAGKANKVVIFDTKTLKVTGDIAVGEGPDSIIYDRASKHIYVFNGKGHSVSVIDPQAKKVLQTISLSGKPESAASDERGNVFVDIEDQDSLVQIDSRKSKVVKEYKLDPCKEPTGLSIDTEQHLLLVGCGNETAVAVDAKDGKIKGHFSVGKGVDATAFNSDSNLGFVSAGEGKLSIFRVGKDNFKPFQELPTQKGARTMAIDSKTGNIFLATAEFGPAPSPSPGQKHEHPPLIPGSFVLIVISQ